MQNPRGIMHRTCQFECKYLQIFAIESILDWPKIIFNKRGSDDEGSVARARNSKTATLRYHYGDFQLARE